ncbi:polyprotein [Termeil virus]|uniref:Envelopment polyprotein n=1 Tax=Termeil virus TaxID=2748250 RepID=A0A7D9MVT5_9VIRU|nr:polyprotein [Termeil virus]QLA47017.1 polyprotein [Termeil virus]
MLFLIFLVSVATSNPLPVHDKCFTGGKKVREYHSAGGLSEICLKDDVGLVKTFSNYAKNSTGIFSVSYAYRKLLVENWEDCSPKKDSNGYINIIEVDPKLVLKTELYICNADCQIELDREDAQVILTTKKLNHYQVSGTTIQTGWFKSKTAVSLDQTCEHVKVSCGKQTTQFHACFKEHRACIRFLHRSILPSNIAESICRNIELIILSILSALIFILLYIISKTYICFIFIPMYIPFCYFYGFIYNKWCKKCNMCGLAYHPFTKCGTHCVCGARYETSERMKMHRERGFCTGFKSLRLARVLCRSKGSHTFISIFSAAMILMFVTPINSMAVDSKLENEEVFTLDDLPDEMVSLMDSIKVFKMISIIQSGSTLAIMLLTLVILALYRFFKHRFISCYAIDCKECDMYHEKRGTIYNGDFTNKCQMCTCGEFENLDGTSTHKKRANCLQRFNVKFYKMVVTFVLISVALKDMICTAAAEEVNSCLSKDKLEEGCVAYLIQLNCNDESKEKTYNEILRKAHTEGKLTGLELREARTMPDGIGEGLRFIREQDSIQGQLLFEWLFYTKHCDYYSDYEHDTSYSQISWRTLIKKNQFKYCAKSNDIQPCLCMSTAVNCAPSTYTYTPCKNFYDDKQKDLEFDIKLLLEILEQIFPGSTYEYIKTLLKGNTWDLFRKFIQKIESKYPNNKLLKTFMKYSECFLTDTNQRKLTKIIGKYQVKPFIIQHTKNSRAGAHDKIETSRFISANKETRCSDIHELACLSPRVNINGMSYLTCKKDTNLAVFYNTKFEIHKSNSDQTTYCLKDSHCINEFEPIEASDLASLKKLHCWHTNANITTNIFDKPYVSCRIIDHGHCNITGEDWPVALCDDQRFYYAEDIEEHDPNGDMGNYCFNRGCKTKRFAISVPDPTVCRWKRTSSRYFKGIKKINMESIQSYKKALTENLKMNLVMYKYKPTANLPHILPNHKYVEIKGTNTPDGVEEAYILVDIPASSGSSIGTSIQTKEGYPLFDLVVYVPDASYYATYEHIYSTGPTTSINVKHEEKCTGRCPESLGGEPNWITFSKERTSQWGCEEWGCMAIDEGCVWGSCQDIIKEELKVFRKVGDDAQKLKVCVTFAHEFYCTELTSISPVTTGKLDIQFETVESNVLPRIVGVRNHKVLIGQINDLGSFSKGCGNVQKSGQSTLGAGQAKFDYVCHPASRKDIIVRKCYDNNWGSCSLLKEEKGLYLTEGPENIVLRNNHKIMGTMKIKITLGDINYKTFVKDFEPSGDLVCVGCRECFENINCEFTLDTEVAATCNLEAACKSSTSTMMITPETKKYAFKLVCDQKTDPNELTVKICNKNFIAEFTETNKDHKIEIDNGDQTAYVIEKDNRCSTWLCKVKEEGLSFIFKPLLDFFGSTWTIVVIVIVGIIILLAVAYILLPVCFKIKETLRKNQELAIKESKMS